MWRDVFVPGHMVASDGFTAEVGGMVEMPLSLYCRYRTRLSADDDRRPAASSIPGDHRHPETRSVHDLVGRAVAMESTVWTAGWMLDVDGLGIYVSEADTGPSPGSSAFEVYREAGSDPAAPVPEPGTWTRVRGQLSIAEPYETGAYEPEAELLRHAVRTWLVHRIVRLDGRSGSGGLPQGRGEDVTVVQHTGLRYSAAWSTLGYLLDLEHADHEGP